MHTTYLILSTAIFGVLFVVWSNKTNLNLFIKVMYFCMFVFGMIVSLTHLGYVLKP